MFLAVSQLQRHSTNWHPLHDSKLAREKYVEICMNLHVYVVSEPRKPRKGVTLTSRGRDGIGVNPDDAPGGVKEGSGVRDDHIARVLSLIRNSYCLLSPEKESRTEEILTR